uniref:HDC11505 n=1 Tax=Drosophila melanogaster TaxID=7227 RepID=Q6IKT5_DROME|nr:TPA_inf: HDC11505 [Drosophila melanogaster]
MSSSSPAPSWELGPWAAPTSSWGSELASTYHIPMPYIVWVEISGLRRSTARTHVVSLGVDSSDSLGVNSNRANYPLRIGDVLSLLRTSGINDKLRFDEVDVDQVTHCGQKNLTSYQRSHK